MNRIRDIESGTAKPFTASQIGDLDEPEAVIAQFLLGPQAPREWKVYHYILEHTPWRSLELDWYVRTPNLGAFVIRYDRFYTSDKAEGEAQDFGLLYKGTAKAVIHVSTETAADLPATTHAQLSRLLRDFGASTTSLFAKKDKFESKAEEYPLVTALKWNSNYQRMAERGKAVIPFEDVIVRYDDEESPMFAERLMRWDKAEQQAIKEKAAIALWDLTKGKQLSAKFVRRYAGDRLVAVQARQLKIAVWLESAYLDPDLRDHPDCKAWEDGNIEVVAEDDLLLSDPKAVAMRIAKPISYRLSTGWGPRARVSDGDDEVSTPTVTPFADDGRVPVNEEVEIKPERRREAFGVPRAVALKSANTVTISGILQEPILFVEAEQTGGRAEFFLAVQHTYAGSRDGVPCTSFGHESIRTLQEARVGDYMLVSGEIRVYKEKVYIYAKNILAILPTASSASVPQEEIDFSR